MLPQPLIAPALTSIFAKMTAIYNCPVGSWHRAFMFELFRTVIALRGRVNFTNMARYSRLCEQTFRRHFAKAFAWVAFNLTVLRLRRHPDERLIGVFDATFLPKSGTETYGLDRFFSSAAGRLRRGLEVSILGVVTTTSRRAIGIEAAQTPAGLAKEGPSRVDIYLAQITRLLGRLAEVVYWVGDGYYAKRKVFEALTGAGRHLVTRLRSDANLRYLYRGPQNQGPGAPRQYDGKIDWSDADGLLRRFEAVGRLEDRPQVRILTTVANSPHFRRNLRIVVLMGPGAERYVVLSSTDTEQPAEQIVRYYRLRYQIELVIRDAKQHAGLTHCQARSREKLDFHLNMSLATVNLLRLLAAKAGLSVRSVRRRAYNRLIVGRLLSQLGLGAEYGIMHPRIRPVVQIGQMAAWPESSPR